MEKQDRSGATLRTTIDNIISRFHRRHRLRGGKCSLHQLRCVSLSWLGSSAKMINL
jgi:hypothetical protein